MRIMTINVWADCYNNPVELREDGIYNVITKHSPDVFGLQEMSLNWHLSKFSNAIADEYTCVEIYQKNHVPVYFKTDKYDLLECGWELYDETPDISKGITWAVINEKKTGKKIGVCNTHLWFKEGEEHDRIREKNTQQLLKRMDSIKNKYGSSVFAFGDFNCCIGSSAMNYLEKNNVYTSFKLTENHSAIATYHDYPIKGDDGKYHGIETKDDKTKSLDHIVAYKDDVVIKKQEVVVYQEILDSTDHSPVYIDVEI